MTAIIKREIKNYLKRPLFWIGVAVVILGVFQNVSPYLETRYVSSAEELENDLPETVHAGDVYEGYIPTEEAERRTLWEKQVEDTLRTGEGFELPDSEVEAVMAKIRKMDVDEACLYLENEYQWFGAEYFWEESAYRKGTPEEINAYLDRRLEEHPFSWYFARKFADFAGLFMGFAATVLLAVLFFQDMKKNTYELLHTKPVSAWKYVTGKVAGGFLVCVIILGILNLVFWAAALICTRGNGFEIHLIDFLAATCLYILPNMLMIVCVYALVALIFKNPLPAAPLLVLYMLYSNMGSRNAEGVFGYYGRPLAIMVRFPGMLFDTAPPPMAMVNQCCLIAASFGIILICVQLWRRRRI